MVTHDNARTEEQIQADIDALEGATERRTGSEVSTVKRPFSDAELRNLDTLDGIRALLGDQIGNAADLGSGFAVVDNDAGKGRLVGLPLLFLFWTFNPSKVGSHGEFVSAHVVQLGTNGAVVGKFIVNDGSTGIYQQLKDYTADKGTAKGLFVPKGLRRSDYEYADPTTGDIKPATTFYLDTSA